jgi:hypothetical protein
MVRTKIRPTLLGILAMLLPWLALASSSAQDIRLAYGHWKIDIDETARLNPFAPKAAVILFAQGVTDNPFILSVSEKDFITTSRIKVIHDTYEVTGSEKGVFTLSLTSKDKPETQHRLLKMQPKGDRLYLDYRERSKDSLLVVFIKAREEEKQFPPKQ